MKRLIDICDIQYGYAFDSKCFTEDSSYPQLVRIRDVKRGYSETYYSGDYPEEYILSEGDLLVGMDGEFNIARWKSSGALLNQRVCKLTAKVGINGEYIRFAMSKALKEIERKTAFVTVKHLSAKELNKLELDVPKLSEQDRIADTLNRLEKVIEARQEELDKLDDLIKARFVELFGHQSHNEKSLPYMTIDDVAEIYLGITHTPIYVDSGVMFISAKNTSGDFLDLSDVKYISREEFEGAPKGSKPQVNDVLFSRVGSNLGHPVILEEELELCTFVSLGFLRSKGIVTSNYLKHWMRDEFFAKQVSEHVKGGGQPNLNTGWLKEFKIIVPGLEGQKEFDDFCKQVDKSKVAVKKALDETQMLFDSLMQKYFA